MKVKYLRKIQNFDERLANLLKDKIAGLFPAGDQEYVDRCWYVNVHPEKPAVLEIHLDRDYCRKNTENPYGFTKAGAVDVDSLIANGWSSEFAAAIIAALDAMPWEKAELLYSKEVQQLTLAA